MYLGDSCSFQSLVYNLVIPIIVKLMKIIAIIIEDFYINKLCEKMLRSVLQTSMYLSFSDKRHERVFLCMFPNLPLVGTSIL